MSSEEGIWPAPMVSLASSDAGTLVLLARMARRRRGAEAQCHAAVAELVGEVLDQFVVDELKHAWPLPPNDASIPAYDRRPSIVRH